MNTGSDLTAVFDSALCHLPCLFSPTPLSACYLHSLPSLHFFLLQGHCLIPPFCNVWSFSYESDECGVRAYEDIYLQIMFIVHSQRSENSLNLMFQTLCFELFFPVEHKKRYFEECSSCSFAYNKSIWLAESVKLQNQQSTPWSSGSEPIEKQGTYNAKCK